MVCLMGLLILTQDGQFPINLSKIQVEKDHEFLEQADIDSLVRRLNILNRCADLMEEIKSKKVGQFMQSKHTCKIHNSSSVYGSSSSFQACFYVASNV